MIQQQEINRALIVEKIGPDAQYKIVEEAVPVPKDDEVLIRLSYTGVCHSDLAFIRGKYEDLGLGFEGSRTPGHEGVGRVVSAGPSVKDVKIGARVGVRWIKSVCNSCDFCLAGNDHWCPSQVAFGKDVGGSFQQYVTAPGDYLVPIPDNVPDEAAAPLLCAGVTMYRALKVSKAKKGDWIVINGAGGGLGHMQVLPGIKFAQVMGLRVIAVDIGLKADFCRRLGAEHFVDVLNTSDLVGTVKRLTSDKATAVIATASNAQAYQDAARMLGNGGTLVCVGLPQQSCTIPLQVMEYMHHSLNVTGVAQAPRRDVIEMLDFVEQHRVMPEVEVHAFDLVEEVLEALGQQKIQGRAVLSLQ